MIKLYRASDDSLISEDGSNPISFTLRADLNESDSIRVYAEAEAGYIVTSTTAQPTGTTNLKWALAPDDNGSEGTYAPNGDQITLGTVENGESGRVHFWVQAEASDDEEVQVDETVTIDLEGIAEPA